MQSTLVRLWPTHGIKDLNGRKIWSTGAHLAHYMIVLARTSKQIENNRHAGLSQFLVDLSIPGVEINGIEDMTGQKLFNETVFETTVDTFNRVLISSKYSLGYFINYSISP